MMNLDQSLAFTAILELWPLGVNDRDGLPDEVARPLTAELAAAMTAANPKDRWAFAKQWVADKRVAEATKPKQGVYGLPWPGIVDYETALAIARSKHPSRVLANTEVYRYGRFTECPPDGRHGGFVSVTMMGNEIARFRPEGVQLSWCGRVTVSSTEALSNLVSGGYFFAKDRVIHFRDYSDSGPTTEVAKPATDHALYHYHRPGRGTSCPSCGCQTGGD